MPRVFGRAIPCHPRLSAGVRNLVGTAYFANRLKKLSSFQCRPRRIVGDTLQQRHDHAVEFRRRLEIHRLIQIVGRLMIDVAHPVAGRVFSSGEPNS